MQEAREGAEWLLSENNPYGVTTDENELAKNVLFLADRVATLEAALRPFAENWDLHAAPYLTLVDDEEARVLTARTVNDMLAAVKAARAALGVTDDH